MKKTYFADLVLLGVTFTWGATFVLVQGAIEDMPAFTFLGVRFLFAGLLLALFMLAFFRQTLKGLTKEFWKSSLLIGFWLFLGYAFQTFGLLYTTPSKSGFITGLSVVIVPFLSLWLLRHPLKRNALLGVIVAAAGLAMLSLNKEAGVNIGDLLTLLCAVSFAMHITLVGRYAPKYGAFPLALMQILVCGVFNMIGAFLFEDVRSALSPDIVFSPTVLSALLICSVIATAFAFVVQNQFQKFTSPTRTALIFSTEPVFAAITAVVCKIETLSLLQIMGCVLILGGTLIAELGGGGGDDHKTAASPEPGTSPS